MTIPDISDDNLLQLDQLETQITLSEIQERTLEGFIRWTVINPNNMITRFGEFDLYLSVLNGQGDSHLDVLRYGVNVLTLQSVVHPEITDILKTVRDLAASPDFYDELITRAYKTYRRCPFFERGMGGIEIGGLSISQVVLLSQGGVVVDGASNNTFTEAGSGGAVIDGTEIDQYTPSVTSHGGIVMGGHSIDYQRGDVTPLADTGGYIFGLAAHPTKNLVYVAHGNSIDIFDKAGNLLTTQNVPGIVPISMYGISLDATNHFLFVSIQNNIWGYVLNSSTGLFTGTRTLAYDNSISPNPGPTGWWESNGPIAVANGGGTIYFSTTGPSAIAKLASSSYNDTGFASANGATFWPGQMLTRSGSPWCNTGYSGDYNSGVQGYNLKTSDFTSQTALPAPLNAGTSFCHDVADDLFFYTGLQSSVYSLYKMPATGGSATKVSGPLTNYGIIPSDYDPITTSVFIAQYNELCQILL